MFVNESLSGNDKNLGRKNENLIRFFPMQNLEKRDLTELSDIKSDAFVRTNYVLHFYV
jgi:hypothetical protein